MPLGRLAVLLPLLLGLCAALPALRAAEPTSPRAHFGFAIGDDHHLATYTQTEAYFQKLARESDRMRLVDLGPTEEGRRQWMLVCSSPANLARIDRLREISRRLGRGEDADEATARALAAEGRAVVWIDGGLHATETVATHQLIETAWQLASRQDAETRRILDETVVLLAHANPDGQELVSNWYMRNPVPAKRSYGGLPRLYQKYIGHDNNRDFFLGAMKESANLNRQLYVEWIPQILYNHHQSSPTGTIVAGPPYRDPFNHVYDPALVTTLDGVGAAMAHRLHLEGKPGYTRLTGSVYSTWWNGGLRTTAYFHNMVGILTEIAGHPNPMDIPLIPARLVPNGANPFPITPQRWHFAQSIQYSLSMNYAVLDYAARNRDTLLFGIWRMGRNAIERGSRDHWTHYPRRIEAIREAHARDQPGAAKTETNEGARAPAATRLPAKYYDEVVRRPELRDPRGYILPADQADFPTAVKFINALIKGGVTVHRATAAFTVAGKSYPAGSYVVKTAQAFRPHVLDLFEPQDHPNDFRYEGGPPIAPYDAAGWTLAYQMGIAFDRILDGFDGPFVAVPAGELQRPPAPTLPASATGWTLSRRVNDSFTAVNQLLRAGVTVTVAPGGDFHVPARAGATLAPIAAELGVPVQPAAAPAGARPLRPLRVGLWDRYGGSMPSGWTRWILEQHQFPFELVFPPEIDAGNLRQRFDVIVFPSGAVPRPGLVTSSGDAYGDSSSGGGPAPADVPAPYRDRIGRFSAAKSVDPLRAFLEAGGTIVTVGTSGHLASHLGLPVRNALVERAAGAKGERTLPREKFYIPGSILRMNLDPAAPANAGMAAEVDVFFDENQVFRLLPEAETQGLRRLAWFASDAPLRSGWAWGQQHLKDGVTAFEAPIGRGRLLVFTPEITFRAQAQGTFRLLFNALVGEAP
jgi:hypothetical protein